MKVLQAVTSPRSFFDQQVEALERQGVECTTISVPNPPDDGSSRSIREYLQFYPELFRESLDDYDLVHANYGLVAPFALSQPTRPVVLTLWGTDLMSEHGWLRQLSKQAARLSDAVILPSTVLAERLSQSHSLIPFGVDTDLFRPIPKDAARKQVGWRTNRDIVLFPYDTSRAVKDYSRARAVAERADANIELKTVSGVSHDQMPYYMNASDALLVTSRRESGPMVVKEAAACNVPVVSTDVGFVRDVLGDVSNSAVCRSNDELVAGLERVLERDDRADGRDAIDGLDVDEMGAEIKSVYERVLGNQEESS